MAPITLNSRKERSSTERDPQHSSASIQVPSSDGCEVTYLVRGDSQIQRTPPRKVSDGLANDWRQGAALPSLSSLWTIARDMEDQPNLGCSKRSQSWAIAQPRAAANCEPSGFNPNPRRGQDPRRPPPLPGTPKLDQQAQGCRRKLTTFVEPPAVCSERPDMDTNDGSALPVRTALASKDANERVQRTQT